MESTDKLAYYHELFPDAISKAKAFDEIAEHVYAGNFGQISKGDFEVLLFHLYIERILANGDKDFKRYNDYTLARELGITQSKVSNLKVKKQLQYPHAFDWRQSFAIISDNARYENGKIKIQIPDINLYYEIKNAVEDAGGYIEMTLTRQLLQISPEYFLDLLVAVCDNEDDRKQIRRSVREEVRKHNKDAEFFEEKPIGTQIVKFGKGFAVSAINTLAKTTVNPILQAVLECISKAFELYMTMNINRW